ncbi:hypothetical protein I4U23_016168 [Adineta vaga]|nr:hypothetical protein I4U23_016168 [Adineta vaga]
MDSNLVKKQHHIFQCSWNETQLNYDLIHSGIHRKIVASIRQWDQISAITFHLNTGDQILTNTIPLDKNQVRTIFPSFYIEQIDINDQRAYFTFEGFEGGPIILFNQTQRGEGDMLVISLFSKFMATSLTQTNNTLEYGVMSSMFSITPNYNHSLIVFYSSNGINEGMKLWGRTMQKAYNRTNQYRINDLTINKLGYYTDNGAYYYYNTENNTNYEQTMLDVIHNISLPLHYLQIDSWWYYKGIDGGVSEWIARPDIFPHGLPEFHRKSENIPFVAHNRYWSYDTVYKQNYSFVFDEKTGKALPVGNDSFWIDLFTQVYEQDWLVTQTEDFQPLHRIPHVTQTRVSTDYAFHLEGKAQQWTIGISSMFADAIGLAPFKDVFWSTGSQTGATNYTPTPHEVQARREIAIATLSTGPVTPGDGIHYVNYDKTMQCYRSVGLILKPDQPITMINALLSDCALNDGVSQGEVYSTKTTIDDDTFHVIFAPNMKKDYNNQIIITAQGLFDEPIDLTLLQDPGGPDNIRCWIPSTNNTVRVVLTTDRAGCA